jgi:predicted aspartyl protease
VPNSGKTSNYLNREEEAEEEVESNYTIYSLGKQKTEPYVVEVLLNEESVKMEVDTGAAMSVISEDTFRALKKKHPCLDLCESKVRLHTYTGEQVKVAGQFKTSVKYEEQEIVLPVLVIQGKGPNLIGRNWLQKIKLNWRNIFQLEEANTTNTTTQRVEELVQKYEQVFQEVLGTFTGPKANIHVAADAKPIYCKARPVPYSLKKKVEEELERLQAEGTVEPVQFAEWAAPIVPVVKEDKSVRICGDYKVTVNQAAKLDNYPIPKAEDLFATLSGGDKFSKLDMSQAYQQIPLEDQSKKFTTINTHKGLFQFNRFTYGVSS